LKQGDPLRRGITTLELIVVVAVVGFLFTITAMSIKNFIVPSAEDTSSQIVAALHFARNHALLNHKSVVFYLDMDKGEYRSFRVEREDDGIKEVPITKTVKLPFNNKIFSAVDIGGREVKNDTLRIVFGFDGTSEDYTLLMGEEGNVKKSIQIFRYGGRIRVLNGENIRIASKKLEKIDYGVDERLEQETSDINRY